MYFLKNQKDNPDFLNFYLKYSRFISLNADTTVNELNLDIRTFLRYILLTENKELSNNVTLEDFRNISIKDFDIEKLNNVTPHTITDFIFFLRNFFDNSARTRNRKLASLKNFFKYLSSNNLITRNPTANIEFANIGKRNPKHLTLEESKKMLSVAIKSGQRNSIRNYTIICLFLNCCLRLSELVGINLEDLKLDDKTLKIRGKGDSERIVYLDEAVLEALSEYLKTRDTLPRTNEDYNALFLSERKKRISRRNVQNIIEQELSRTFDEKRQGYHTHTLRHTGATLMYNENDTNILIIQKILGHKLLSSTEIYTSVSDKKLKEIMENCTISSILKNREENRDGK